MTEQFVFYFEILIRKADVKRTLVSKNRKEEVIDHILQGDHELTNKEEECMKRGAPMMYQVPETLNVSETLKVPGNRHGFQNPGTLQTTHKFLVGKFPVHPNRPTSDLPKNEVEENRNRLPRSLLNLEI